MMGKELEAAVVMKAGTEAAVAVHTRAVVCPHTAAAAAKWPWLS